MLSLRRHICGAARLTLSQHPQHQHHSVTSFATRNFSSVKRSHPYVLTDLPNGRTAVTLSGDPSSAVTLGTFSTDLRNMFIPGFSLESNPQGEPEILIEKPDLFSENPEFWKRASALLKSHIHEDAVYGDLAAAETRTQYFHIYDLRLPPLFGRIPEVEDILGTVELDIELDVTKIVPHSFEPNSMYRPVTQYGGMLLSPAMHRLVAKGLFKG